MTLYCDGGTRPANTSDSVPREMPLASARTRTSSSRGWETSSSRISPRPEATVQNARALTRTPSRTGGGPRAVHGDIEQHILAEPVRRPGEAHAEFGPRHRRQRERGNAVAEQQRRDGHVQAVEQSGGEEARHGDTAALHQQPPQSPPGERRNHGR